MKYYLIVGEASGDLHASHLMAALKESDPEAQFRFFGGDLMTAVGGKMVKHYRELAYMGFIPVLMHLKTIYANMRFCKQDIVAWQPDVLLLVDYPGFNLNIAKYIHRNTKIPVYYYISPKIWAWKEYRIKNIKRDVDELFSILPFEVDFFEGKHHYPIHYVGNPTLDEVTAFQAEHQRDFQQFVASNGLTCKPVIALLAGSRKQEIKDNLPMMVEAAQSFGDYQMVLAGAPGIAPDYYQQFLKGTHVKLVFNKTYELLQHADAACYVGYGYFGDGLVPCASGSVLLHRFWKGGEFLQENSAVSEICLFGESHCRQGGGAGTGGRPHDRGECPHGIIEVTQRQYLSPTDVAGL